MIVVAQRLAVLGLVFLAEVTAAGLFATQRVVAHQLGQLEEIGDPVGVLEALVELLVTRGRPADRTRTPP